MAQEKMEVMLSDRGELRFRDETINAQYQRTYKRADAAGRSATASAIMDDLQAFRREVVRLAVENYPATHVGSYTPYENGIWMALNLDRTPLDRALERDASAGRVPTYECAMSLCKNRTTVKGDYCASCAHDEE